jgi:hypothetical protein
MTKDNQFIGGDKPIAGQLGIEGMLSQVYNQVLQSKPINEEKKLYIQSTINNLKEIVSQNPNAEMNEEDFTLLMTEINKHPKSQPFIERPIITPEQATQFLNNAIPASALLPKFSWNTLDPEFYKYYNELTFGQDVEYDTLRNDDGLFRMLMSSLGFYYEKSNTTKAYQFNQHYNNQNTYNVLIAGGAPQTDVLSIIDSPGFAIYMKEFLFNTFRIHVADCAHDWTSYLSLYRNKFKNPQFKPIFDEIVDFVSSKQGNVNQPKCQEKVRQYGSNNIDLINKSLKKNVLIPQKGDCAKFVGVLAGDYQKFINT